MHSVLADLALESEAATVLSCDWPVPSTATSRARALRRALTSAAKFWVCKRGWTSPRKPWSVGRQRLRGGIAPGAHGARVAGEFHLGGLGQRHVPGRPARLWKSSATRAAVLDDWPAPAAPRQFDAAFERFAG